MPSSTCGPAGTTGLGCTCGPDGTTRAGCEAGGAIGLGGHRQLGFKLAGIGVEMADTGTAEYAGAGEKEGIVEVGMNEPGVNEYGLAG